MPKDTILTVVKDTVFIKDTIYRTEIITVYKDTIQKTELTELYQNLLQNQSSNYTTLITTLLVITGALLGATWLWNFYLAKKQIKQEVEEEILKVKEAVKQQIENQINEKFNALESSLQFQIRERETALSLNIEQLQGKAIWEIKRNRAETSRLFGLYNLRQNKDYKSALMWFSSALTLYAQTKNVKFVRIVTEAILRILEKEPWYESATNNTFKIEEIIIIAQKCIPDIMSKEREKIVSILESRL